MRLTHGQAAIETRLVSSPQVPAARVDPANVLWVSHPERMMHVGRLKAKPQSFRLSSGYSRDRGGAGG